MSQKIPVIDFSFALASSVHDMKNSLGMLLNTLSDVIALYPPQNDSQASAYAILEYEAARINSELIQLLSLYRLEHDQICVNVDEYPVIDVLSDQVARNDMLFKTRNVQIELVCDESLQGYFDIDLISGVVNNILVNAIRYCKQRVRISAHNTAEGLCIGIEDDGPGYPADMLDLSAQTESRISFSNGRPHLGVVFAQKIALMHESKTRQGFIRLGNDSHLGGGYFRIFLP